MFIHIEMKRWWNKEPLNEEVKLTKRRRNFFSDMAFIQ